MIKHNAKNISNILKIVIVGFIFFNYMYQSKIAGHPLTSDEGKCLLYIAICGFLILCPIDASIFIKNLKSINEVKKERDNENA
ncbi:hypothetical protein [Brachyspira aalborgi]|jgi:hypothetical protein|uniref:DUF2892 domain-containing protein n=1 Tax=Brachyspira aalborgi TaxID=29522 RepID=A0ABY3K6P4_9SPIR|nr:hypothetical protein [Brachyspira aalborgi]TXJ31159.1 hypothetical protein EPJ71_10520 [Brachyspira aalborgi]TXJ40049.1 hypothetical protein EPJ65_12460 [Brachyspira aalborgi]DAZ18865.1 MAG TPA: hypothetical protein [Caudoviricetes sp.]